MEPKKLPATKFTNSNSADANRVFLYEAAPGGLGMKPIPGWKIVGWGKAPWPGTTEGFAAMFEKTSPAKERRSIFDRNEDCLPEGTQIWHHYRERWVRGNPYAP